MLCCLLGLSCRCVTGADTIGIFLGEAPQLSIAISVLGHFSVWLFSTSSYSCEVEPFSQPPWLMQVGEAWRNYSRRVETDPVPTKAMTSLVGFMLGDFLAQRIEGRPFNPLRRVTSQHFPLRFEADCFHLTVFYSMGAFGHRALTEVPWLVLKLCWCA